MVKKNQAHPRVVSLLQHGYHLDLKILPKFSKIPLILSEYQNVNKDGALHEAVQAMLAKNATAHVRKPTTLGYYSSLFLVPKPLTKWRLKAINKGRSHECGEKDQKMPRNQIN